MTKLNQRTHCVIYKSSTKVDTYLFVLKAEDFSNVPDTLLKALGDIENIMELDLTPESQLARNNTKQVLLDLQTQGFHLQMPPHKSTI
jgi:uncharacterized protein YcgL (UPF0745 family)